MEGEPSYTLLTNQDEVDDRLLFSLAPAPHRWPHLMIIGGSPGQLTGLNALMNLMSELSIKYDLFVPTATQQAVPWLKAHALPEPGQLQSGAPLQQSLIDSSAIIAGIGLHVTSGTQIGLEKLLLSLDHPTVITDELLPLYKTNPLLLQLKPLIPFLSLPQLIKMLGIGRTDVKLAPGRGIFNVGTILTSLPTAAPFVMTYDKERIYTYVRDAHSVIHTPIPDGFSVDDVRSTMVAALTVTLWADRGIHELVDVIKLAHYLFAHVMNGQTPPEVAKELRGVLEPKFT